MRIGNKREGQSVSSIGKLKYVLGLSSLMLCNCFAIPQMTATENTPIVTSSEIRPEITAEIATEHVPSGCYPDAVVYIEKMSKRFPDHKFEIFTIPEENASLWKTNHTVVLIKTPKGDYIGRDENYGLSWINRDLSKLSDERRGALVGRIMAKDFTEKFKNKELERVKELPSDTLAQRWAAANKVASWIKGAEIYTAAGEPVVFWRGGDRVCALYKPDKGTASAEISTPNVSNLAIVTALAEGWELKDVKRLTPEADVNIE